MKDDVTRTQAVEVFSRSVKGCAVMCKIRNEDTGKEEEIFWTGERERKIQKS
jgi:hypothetical protein